MSTPEPIRVAGLREFTRALRRADRELVKGLRLASNRAADLVVAEAKPRVPIGPGRGGHAAASIKAASTSKAARIQAGGKRYPYYPWLDFGGRVGPGGRTTRPFLKSGRYIWAAYSDKRPQVEAILAAELTSLAAAAGLGPT